MIKTLNSRLIFSSLQICARPLAVGSKRDFSSTQLHFSEYQRTSPENSVDDKSGTETRTPEIFGKGIKKSFNEKILNIPETTYPSLIIFPYVFL